jgi:ATP-dependent protease ClpP protease subunit
VRNVFLKVLLLLPLALFSTAATEAKKEPESVELSASNLLVMDMEYTPESVAKVAMQARELDAKLPPWSAIYLVILSPGGDIEAGLELIDNLNALGRKIHTVTLFSASMAFQNVQGVPGKRYVTSSGTLMSHKARGGFKGEFPGQLDSRYNYWKRRLTRLDEITVARSRGKLTLASYQAAYENEYWCEGQDCVDAGYADAVANVSCDSSLSGTKELEYTGSFLGIPVTAKVVKAACPTITAVLGQKVTIGGENVSPEDFNTITRKFNLTPKDAEQLRQLVERKIEELAPARNITKGH